METNVEDEAVEILDEDEEMEDDDHDVIGSKASSSTPLAGAGNYCLHGVVRHRGRTPLEGHYTVDLQIGNQVWCHHDDSRVTEVDLETVLQKAGGEGHIFFYQHSAQPACSSPSAA
ncbi:hypothetical protein Vretimale_19553 [Volvox reticuliferus]|uniref:USP domain-containing protein n=3 Tax=Volvox reticuliferus TaxID=1737510 RepID=A0A8J4GWZ5_9CHLO|nr:hypothetical protein Vretifemale_14358 [Volvox reticuliferus]GIL85826.1 hypothetical protein Vretifemale_14359 [Volvox reticuliferus]GIM17000.1 hypothetical protein Vretimale_19553 [Volvox reticuliferus]GIM17002.1 hypothetical protein Vretimale_19553 [Volvox reticuliferus]